MAEAAGCTFVVAMWHRHHRMRWRGELGGVLACQKHACKYPESQDGGVGMLVGGGTSAQQRTDV